MLSDPEIQKPSVSAALQDLIFSFLYKWHKKHASFFGLQNYKKCTICQRAILLNYIKKNFPLKNSEEKCVFTSGNQVEIDVLAYHLHAAEVIR